MNANNKYETLRERLLQKIEKKNLSVLALERKAGLKSHAIRNIIAGRSKKPHTVILEAAVKVLGCSIEELFSEHKKEISSHSLLENFKLEKTTLINNTRLFRNSVDLVLSIYEHNNYTPFMEQIMLIIKIVYDFSDKEQEDEPDKRFAEWIITQYRNMSTA